MAFQGSRSVFRGSRLVLWFQAGFSHVQMVFLWFFIVPGRFLWFHADFSWFQAGFYGFSWFQVGFSRFQVGFSRFQVGFHGSKSVFMVFHGSRLVLHGFSWFFSNMYLPKLYPGPTIQSRSAARRAA